jgi:hypothetical protein
MLTTTLNLQDAINKFYKRFAKKEIEQDILDIDD